MPKIGVILLPGILGSPLQKLDGTQAWPVHQMGATNPINVGSWYTAWFDKKLQWFVDPGFLPSTQVIKAKKERSLTLNSYIENVAGIYQDFLNGLIGRKLVGPDSKELKLEADSYSVFVVNYDWARPVMETRNDVVKDTQDFVNTYKCEKFIYVTHSMGGIVGMAALLDPWVQQKCLGIVRVACPVVGAPEATARLVRGILPGDTMQSGIASTMLGNTGRKFSLFAACLPGLASLLPQWGQTRINMDHVTAILNYHFSNDTNYTSPNDNEDASAFKFGNKHLKSLIYRFGENITIANELMDLLIKDASLFTKYVSSITLSGKKTLDSYVVNASPNSPYINPTPKWSQDGDGTVPFSSQGCFSSREIYVDGGIDHADAFSDPRTWPHIIDAMNDLIKKDAIKNMMDDLKKKMD